MKWVAYTSAEIAHLNFFGPSYSTLSYVHQSYFQFP